MRKVDPRDVRIAELETQLRERDEVIARQRAEIEELRAQVRALKAEMEEMEELKARLGQSSRNSHKPPSSDGPGVKRGKSKRRGSRRPGGQPGHKHAQRELLPEEEVDEVVPLVPTRCERCGGQVSSGQQCPAAHRHQVWEVPEVKPYVKEYQLGHGWCGECGVWTRAPLPKGVPRGAFGPRLMALVGLLTGRLRMSKRLVREFLSSVLGMEVSLGGISKLEAALSAALQRPYEEALEYVREQLHVHADETSWRQALKKAWMWVLATLLVTAFAINPRRSGEAARALLGDNPVSFLVSDRWSGYDWTDVHLRQVCWAHPRRDFQGWADRQGEARAIGQRLLRQVRRLFHLHHQRERGELEQAHYRELMAGVEGRVDALLRQAQQCPDKKVAGMAKAMLRLRPALWNFVDVEGLEPTNNRAERALRPAVCMRKVSFGTHSARGSRFVERLLTVSTTLQQQGRDVLQFLTAAAQGRLDGTAPPSLLPSAMPLGP